MAGVCCLVSCDPGQKAAVHFQEGFAPPREVPPVVMLSYNGRTVFSGQPRPNELTGHPYVLALQLGRETNGTLQIAVSGVVTQSFQVDWTKGLALGLQLTNHTVTHIQSAGFGYSLE
jgi:hypothetical protein